MNSDYFFTKVLMWGVQHLKVAERGSITFPTLSNSHTINAVGMVITTALIVFPLGGNGML